MVVNVSWASEIQTRLVTERGIFVYLEFKTFTQMKLMFPNVLIIVYSVRKWHC
jgi:hypothetical protein